MAQSDKAILKSAYPGKKWAEKVDKMSPSQVTAVLASLRRQNKLK